MGKKRELIDDPRFTKIYNDPRFRCVPGSTQKFSLDDRFTGLFSDKKFLGPVPLKVDERGRKVTSLTNPLTELYSCVDGKGNFVWNEQSSAEEEVLQEDYIEEEQWDNESPQVSQAQGTRLALLNCDWNAIAASDLLVLFRSFSSGVVKVAIFPSEFGKERLEKEKNSGPEGNFTNLTEDEPETNAIRKYEKERLKYFYGVLYCDSRETANFIYQNCDGLEIERTSNEVDLRVIPDSTELPYEPIDTAEDVPANYSLVNFYTRALQHSRVEVTWDSNPVGRAEAIASAFHEDDSNLSKYIASPSSDEVEIDIHELPLFKNSQFNRLKNGEIEIHFNSAFGEEGDREITGESKKSLRKKERKDKIKKKVEDYRHKKHAETMELLVDEDTKIEFKPDYEDPRFSSIYTDPTFGIDPTHNSFKRDKHGNSALLRTQIERRRINK